MAYKYCKTPGCNAPAAHGERQCFECRYHPKPVVKIGGIRIPKMPGA